MTAGTQIAQDKKLRIFDIEFNDLAKVEYLDIQPDFIIHQLKN